MIVLIKKIVQYSLQKKKDKKQKQIDIVKHNLNNSKKFGTGAIIAIVLACVVSLASIIGLIIYFRKKNVNKIKDASTVTKFSI